MELYERIRFLAEKKGYSLAKLAKAVGFPQQTFHQWLKPGSQKNLWEHLPKILGLFPEVRPEWLYMGQEPAFHDGTQAEPAPSVAEVEALKARVSELEAELRQADRLNRQLTTKILIDGVGDQVAATNTGKVGEGHV